MPYQITVDSNEVGHHPKLLSDLKSAGFKLIGKANLLLDYQIGNYLIERKRGDDLIKSLMSKHLQKQLFKASTTGKPLILIIEGKIDLELHLRNSQSPRVKYQSVRDYFFGLYTKFLLAPALACGLDEPGSLDLRIVHARTWNETQALLFRIYKYSGKTHKKSEIVHQFHSKKSVKKIRKQILLDLPGIGDKTASKILRTMTIAEFIEAVKKGTNVVSEKKLKELRSVFFMR